MISDVVSFRRSGLRLVGDRWSPEPDEVGGRGTAILLHGGGQRRYSWRATGQRLAREGWTAIALDARGHGDSDWSPDGDYSVDALVGDLAAVVESLGEPAVLVGASMGGTTALVGQGERGDLAKALVLVDIVPKVEQAGAERITAFMAGAPGGFASLEEAADAVAAYNPHRPRPRNPDGLRRNLRQGSDGRWYWHWDPATLRAGDEPSRAAGYQRARAAAARITVPTLLVRGAYSDIVSDEGVTELLELIPGSRYIKVSAAGHMVAGDDNDVFTGRLSEFLDAAVPAKL